MKRALVVTTLIALLAAAPALAQDSGASGQKGLAATMDVYVFPAEGQASAEQSQAEAACYTWAVQNTGTDPFALAKQAEQQTWPRAFRVDVHRSQASFTRLHHDRP